MADRTTLTLGNDDAAALSLDNLGARPSEPIGYTDRLLRMKQARPQVEAIAKFAPNPTIRATAAQKLATMDSEISIELAKPENVKAANFEIAGNQMQTLEEYGAGFSQQPVVLAAKQRLAAGLPMTQQGFENAMKVLQEEDLQSNVRAGYVAIPETIRTKGAEIGGELEKDKLLTEWQESRSGLQSLVDLVKLANEQDAEGESTGASDLAIVFNFMKSLDPRSTVREGEQMQVMNTGGQVAKYFHMWEKVRKGNLLTNDQRNQLVKAAQTAGAERAKTARNQLEIHLSKFGALGATRDETLTVIQTELGFQRRQAFENLLDYGSVEPAEQTAPPEEVDRAASALFQRVNKARSQP